MATTMSKVQGQVLRILRWIRSNLYPGEKYNQSAEVDA